MPYGSPETKIRSVQQSLESGAQSVINQEGGENLSTGFETRVIDDEVVVRVYLTDSTVRPIGAAEFARVWRETVGPITGLVSINYSSTGHGPGGGPALTVELAHSNTQLLQQASTFLTTQLTEYSGASDVSSSLNSGKSQRDIRITEEGSALGLTAKDISTQLRSSLFGVTALSQQEGRNEVSVNVQLDEAYRQSETDLLNLMISHA